MLVLTLRKRYNWNFVLLTFSFVMKSVIFWCFFSETSISLINWDIAFCKLKSKLKQLKAKIIIYVSIIVAAIDIFIIISRFYNQVELTGSHERTLVSTLFCLLTGKVNMDKITQFQLPLPSQNIKTHIHTHTHTPSFINYCKFVIFKLT